MSRSRDEIRRTVETLGRLRQSHPAWMLLAARRGPVVLGCLGALFFVSGEGIATETAIVELAAALGEVDDVDDEQSDVDLGVEARREIRRYVRQGLMVERDGQLIATDALTTALRFVDALQARTMTSTASRLGIVQREIERLDMLLSPDQAQKEAYFERQIAELQAQLEAVQMGEGPQLDVRKASEQLREIHALATSLHRDFRKVEDSYRRAEQALRDSIIADGSHRGEIVDKLLDSHDSLLETDEGMVFDAFHEQLRKSGALEQMRARLRAISAHPLARQALTLEQNSELRLLYMRLLSESEIVMRARTRAERDVKAFLRSGLAAEHHRVGALLNELFSAALAVDWSSQAMRRSPSPLPPTALAVNNLNLIERLRFKQLASRHDEVLNLHTQGVAFEAMEDDFWEAFDALDREALVARTKSLLSEAGRPLSVRELAEQLVPEQDLETLSVWLSMALSGELESEGVEFIDLEDPGDAGPGWRFTVPLYHIDAATALAFEDDRSAQS